MVFGSTVSMHIQGDSTPITFQFDTTTDKYTPRPG